MKFSIIIPVFNENSAIEGVIKNTLEARNKILQSSSIKEVEIIVVDDGSKDRTTEIVRHYEDIILISHLENQGYGRALIMGFEKAGGDLLGFLDADGTCDPRFFIDMIEALFKEKADMVIGTRLGPNSKMPKMRILGNKIFASLINFGGNTEIKDSTSGMRIFKKSLLGKLYPLPSGMDFSPALSCNAIMRKDMKVVEIPISYKERIGASKLRIVGDGFRFLKVILEAILFYRPLKFFITLGLFLNLIALCYSINPIIFYIINRRIEEYFIYRLISIVVFFISGTNFIIFGFLSNEIVSILNDEKGLSEKIKNKPLHIFLSPRRFSLIGLLITGLGISLNINIIKQYIFTGRIKAHWIYVLTGGFLVLLGIEIFIFGFLYRIINFYKIREGFMKTLRCKKSHDFVG